LRLIVTVYSKNTSNCKLLVINLFQNQQFCLTEPKK
jgi:hypothetical protein